MKVSNSLASRYRERALILLIRGLSKAFLFSVNLERADKVRSLKRKQIVSEGLFSTDEN